MQKTVYLFFVLVVLAAFTGHAQQFKGKIVYQNAYRDLAGQDISERLSPYLGKEQRYYISGSHYKTYNENDQLTQLYDPAANAYYLVIKGKGQKLDAAMITSQKHMVTKLSKTEKVAGYACKSISVETDHSSIVYYYSAKVKVDPAAFARHNLGEWNKYLEATEGSLPLKYVLTNRKDGYVMTATATTVEQLPLTERDFRVSPDLVPSEPDAKGEAFDYGQVEGQTYRNKFFGMTMQLPKGWQVQNEEQKRAIMEGGRELVAGNDANMKALIRASEVKTASLLMMFQHEKGAPVDFNPSFTLVAENIATAPGIKSGNDYLFHARKMMERGQIKYSFGKEVYNKTIGNRDFAVMETSLDFNGLLVKQHYYFTIINQFSFFFIGAFMDDAQLQDLEKVVNSMQFE